MTMQSFVQVPKTWRRFLFRLQQTHPEAYGKIRDLVRLAAPFFDDFKLRPTPANPELIQLEWQQKDATYPMLASQLSDGTLRFICLATALVQPQRPRTILFDEPELGLHPYALTLLGNLVQQSIAPWGIPTNQVILSTQSALLLNEFSPEDIVVVDRADGQSHASSPGDRPTQRVARGLHARRVVAKEPSRGAAQA